MSYSEYRSTRTVFKQLINFLKPYYLWVIIRLISTLARAALDITIVILVQKLVNSALDSNKQELAILIFQILGCATLETIMCFMSTYSSGRFSAYVARDIKEELSVKIGKLPLSYIEEHHSGDIVSRLNNDVVHIEDFIRESFLDFVYEVIRFSGCLVFLIFLNWKLLTICIVIISIAMVISNFVCSPLGKYSEQLQDNLAKVNSIAQDSIGGIYILKAFNLSKLLGDKYKSSVNRTLKDALLIEKRKAMIGTASVIMNLVPIIICFLLGGYLVVIGEFTAAGLVAFGQMLTFMGQAAGAVPRYISEFKETMGISKHLFEVLNENIERINGEQHDINTDAPAVEFIDVSFAYNSQTRVLDNIGFTVPNGSTIALVGASGGGKTTIFKLLCGFYEINSGCINLFGKNLNTWSIASVRSLISLVSQDTYLFYASIAENIAYGRFGASFDEVVQVAKASNCHDFIMSLPDGYDTIVGERGTRLSGGQRQRISFARAILKNAPILLLDEPTSALDAETEQLIHESIDMFTKNRTVFVIAHRLSTIRNADKVLVLDQGKIVENGLHDELLKMDGVYKQLYFKQLLFYNDSVLAKVGEGE